MPDTPTTDHAATTPAARVRIPPLTSVPSRRTAWLEPATGRLVLGRSRWWRTVVPLRPTTSVDLRHQTGGPVLLTAVSGSRRVAVPVLHPLHGAERSQPPALLRLLADTLERHRAGGARTVAVRLRAQADHVAAMGPGTAAPDGPVPTAGALALYRPGAPTGRATPHDAAPVAADPLPRSGASVLALHEPTPSGPGRVVARLDAAAGVLTPVRRTLRTGPTRLGGRTSVGLASWRRRLVLDVARPGRWRRACVVLLDLRPGREATQPADVLRALADAIQAHPGRQPEVLVPQLRAQAAHVEAGRPLGDAPLAPLTRGGGVVDALSALPDL